MSEPRYIEVEGDKPKVEQTQQFFSALRAEEMTLSQRGLLYNWACDLNDLISLLQDLEQTRAVTEALQNAQNLREWLSEALDDLRSVEDGQA